MARARINNSNKPPLKARETEDLLDDVSFIKFERLLSRAILPPPAAFLVGRPELRKSATATSSLSLIDLGAEERKEFHESFIENLRRYLLPPSLIEKKIDKITARSIVDEFFDHTTIHGFWDVYYAPRRWLGAVWIIIMCFVFSFFIYQAATTFTASPIQVFIEAVKPDGMQLPQLTICNAFHFNRTRLRQDPFISNSELPEYILESINSVGRYMTNDQEPIIASRYNDGNVSRLESQLAVIGTLMKSENGGLNKRWLRELLREWSPRCEQMLLKCRLDRAEVDCCNASVLSMSADGACFTLTTARMEQRHSGVEAGFAAIMDLHSELKPVRSLPKTVAQFAKGAITQGLSLDIGDRHSAASALYGRKGSILVPPGTQTNIAIHAERFIADVNCGSAESNLIGRLSEELCKINCTISAVVAACRCIPVNAADQLQHSVSICTPREIFACAIPTMRRSQASASNCTENLCLPDCDKWKYIVSTSYSLLDYEEFQDTFAVNESIQRIRANYVLLNLFYDRLEYKQIQQTSSTDWQTTFGVIGGQLSLCTGMSVASLIQVVVYIGRVIAHRIHKRLKPKREINVKRASMKSLKESESCKSIEKLTMHKVSIFPFRLPNMHIGVSLPGAQHNNAGKLSTAKPKASSVTASTSSPANPTAVTA